MNLFFLLAIFNIAYVFAARTVFEIVVPTYNNEKYCIGNLESLKQDYPKDKYHITVVNDCSTDRTRELIEEYIEKNNLHNMITLINNTQRVGAMANWYNAIHALPDETVVVNVDGDDRLIGPKVLSRVAIEYEKKGVWVTYGQYVRRSSGERGHCAEYLLSYRNAGHFRGTWFSSHLRTYKAWIFKQIKLKDCQDSNGNFLPKTCDMAIMYPILEMAAPNHISFIPEILYDYNDTNPISDTATGVQLQMDLASFIRSKPAYQKIFAPIYNKQ